MKALARILFIFSFVVIGPTLLAAFPLSRTDASGTVVTLKAQPRRIVSLTLYSDEILVDLVPASAIAALGLYAADADLSNVRDKALKVPARIDSNVEAVLAQRPDLVFVADWTEVGRVRQLREAGVPVFLLATPTSFATIRSTIKTIGELTGYSPAANELIKAMDKRLGDLAKRLAKVESAKRRTVLDYSPYGAAFGTGSSWDALLQAAGCRNAVAAMTVNEWGQVPVGKETILALDPDWLILPAYVWGDTKGAGKFHVQVLSDPALQGMKAIRGGKVIMFPERLKTTTSHYLAYAAEYLARQVYPELF